jgi:DNA-binding NarL/FixJ family response regulator
MTRRLKIFIADDDAFFLSAIQLIIQEEEGMEVVGTSGTASRHCRKSGS